MGVRPVDIFVNSRGSMGAVDAARDSIREFSGAIKNVAGISLGVGIERAFEGIKESIRESAQEFVKFSAEMETAQYSIAAMQRQFAPGQFRNFNAALQGSGEVLDAIKKKAAEYHLGIEDVVETYKTSSGAMYAGGIKDLEKQIDLAVMLQGAMRGLGVTGFQATRDIQDILTGRSHMTKAGRELGLNDEEIKKAEEGGKLFEYLQGKFGGYAEAAKAAGETFNAALADFNREVLNLGADLSKPMFEELKNGVSNLVKELQQPEFRESLRPLGDAAEKAAHAFFEGTKLAAEHADVIVAVGKAFAILVAAATAWKALEIGAGLVMLAARWIAATAATEMNTAALIRNAVAARSAAAANAAATVAGGAAGTAAKGSMAAGLGTVLRGAVGAYGAAAAVGATIGYFNDRYNSYNPIRRLYRKSGMSDLGDSGLDDDRANAERTEFGKHQEEFSKEYKSIESVDTRVKLEKKLKDQIEERRLKMDDAGHAEQKAIQDSIEGLQRELHLVENLTEAKLKDRTVRSEAQAEVNRLISEGQNLGGMITDTENDLQGTITSNSPVEDRIATEARLRQARENTGISDFTNYSEMRDRHNAIKARAAEVEATLEASKTAKDQKAAGQKFNEGDILSNSQEETLLKEQGLMADTLKVYRTEFQAGIEAQEKLRQIQLKIAEESDQRRLENAKSRGDGSEVARIEEKMTHDKALEQGRAMGLDPKTAENWAQGAVEATKAERQASLDRFQKETEIALLKKNGNHEQARLLEKQLLIKDYATKYGLDNKAAAALADKELAAKRENVGAVRPEVDRYTRIGLFTGVGAQNPLGSLEGLTKQSNDYLATICTNTANLSSDTSIVGDY